MVDIYLAIALFIIALSVLIFYITFRFVKDYLDNYFKSKWTYVETGIYQNTETGDVIACKNDDMILVETGKHKGQYIKAQKEIKVYYYDKIIEEETNE
jgi:hypothetical protein